MEISQVQQQSLLNSNYNLSSSSQIGTSNYIAPQFRSAEPSQLNAEQTQLSQNSFTEVIGQILETLMVMVERLVSALTQGNATAQPNAGLVDTNTQAQAGSTAESSQAAESSASTSPKSEESFFDKIGGYVKKGMKVYDAVSDLFGFKSKAKDIAKKWTGKATDWLQKAGDWAKGAGEKVGSWLNTAGDYAAKAGNWLADGASSIGNWVSGLFA